MQLQLPGTLWTQRKLGIDKHAALHKLNNAFEYSYNPYK